MGCEVFNIYVKNTIKVKIKDDLIYDLIFSEKVSYIIDISDYLDDIYRYEEFILEIKKILKKSKVSIAKSNVLVDSKTAIWELKVKK
jgi:hypothetical protein